MKKIALFVSISTVLLAGLYIALAQNAHAVSFIGLDISADTRGKSANSYPHRTVRVTVEYTPEVSDLYKDVIIVPVVSKTEPTLPYSIYSWGDDTDILPTPKIVQPTTLDTISVTFTQPLVVRGANYIGCMSVREDYDESNYIYEASAMCDNAVRIIYTGVDLPVWRFWSTNYQSHFYTLSHKEKAEVINKDRNWKYEKPAYIARTHQRGTDKPLYRFWSKTKKSHFYTANPKERDDVIRNYSDDVWKYEKVAFYIQPYSGGCQYGSKPIFRFWSTTKQSHFYTASYVERDEVMRKYSDRVWRYEGPKFCAW